MFLRLSMPVILCALLCAVAYADAVPIQMSCIGFPTEDEQEEARRILDLQVFGDRLYIGHGNQIANTGPTEVLHYDFTDRSFKGGFTVDDEEINQYHVFDDTLVIPGADATEDWSYGNFYVLEGEKWTKHRNIRSALHVYDTAALNGRWYVCTHGLFDDFPYGTKGLPPGVGMIFSSGDRAQTWQFEYAVACEINRDSHIRDLVAFHGKLYAFPYSHTFPNTESFKEVHGEKRHPILDLMGPTEALVFDTQQWKQMDLVNLPDIKSVKPFLVGDKLGLWVTRIVEEKEEYRLFDFDGEEVQERSFPDSEPWRPLDFSDQEAFFVCQSGTSWNIIASKDLLGWKHYRLPQEVGLPLCVTRYQSRLYVGNEEGKIFRSDQQMD